MKLSIAPEVLPVAVPFLCIQPLVENAVRHGLEGGAGTGTITIQAHDRGRDCVIEVEDDGAGDDPEKVRRALAGDTSPTRSGSATSTAGCGRRTATSTGSSSRPPPARARR